MIDRSLLCLVCCCLSDTSHILSPSWRPKERRVHRNISLIKLALQKVKHVRKKEGIRNTWHTSNQEILPTAEAIYCWLDAICASRYDDAPRCQSSARWENIDLAHEFVSVLMRLSPRQQNAFHHFDCRNNPEKEAASSCPEQTVKHSASS